jgi:hypothetical protein
MYLMQLRGFGISVVALTSHIRIAGALSSFANKPRFHV